MMFPTHSRAALAAAWLAGALAAAGCSTPQPSPAPRPGVRTEEERRLVERARTKGWLDPDAAAAKPTAAAPPPPSPEPASVKPRAAPPVKPTAAPAGVPAASVLPEPPAETGGPSVPAAAAAPPPPVPAIAASSAELSGSPRSAAEPGACIELRDVELKDVLRAAARMSGKNLIVPEDLTQKITLSLSGVSLDEALDAVLKANQLELVEEAGLHRVQKIREPAPKMESRAFTLVSVPIGSVQKSIEPLLTPQGKMVVNSESNSFLVIDFPEAIERVSEFVKLLDRREKQVLIEARILEVLLSRDDEIGVSLAFSRISLDDVTATFVQDLRPTNRAFRFTAVGDRGRITLLLDAIAQKRRVNILSHPSVATVNGQQATIEVLEAIPYIDSTATTTTLSGGIGSTTVSQVKFADRGIVLTVVPVIGDDRVIKMKVVPEVRELTDFFNGIPVIDRRRVETSILVRDSQTIVIGGLMRENQVEDETKTPILGDIPILGALFRRRQQNVEKSELLVLITPTILDPGADDALTREREERLEQQRLDFDRDYRGEKR